MAKEKSGIYQIRNKIDGKFYIGSSKNIKERWKTHIRELKNNSHTNSHLQNAWNKYGEENFEFSIVENCDQKDLIVREQYYIDLYQCYNHDIGYNIMVKANLSVIPDEVKEKISNTLKGRYVGEHHCNHIYTEDQIKAIIPDLICGELSTVDISKKHNIPAHIVRNVKYKSAWNYLTNGLNFPNGNDFGYIKKLNEDFVLEVIEYLLDGKSDNEIAIKFNVNRKTISDIRHHKTWKKLTDGYTFPSSNGLKRNKENNKSKLTLNQVKEIKKYIKNDTYTLTNLGKMYGISVSAISNIKNGKSYKYI